MHHAIHGGCRERKYDMLQEAVAHYETLRITLLGSALNYVCPVQLRAL